MSNKRTLLWYFWTFARELYEQLESDQERWGDEWKKRPLEADKEWRHQNVRIYDRFDNYLVNWLDNEIPIPWLKIAGLAMIGWVREHYPSYDAQ